MDIYLKISRSLLLMPAGGQVGFTCLGRFGGRRLSYRGLGSYPWAV